MGRITRGGNGNPLQYSCLGNPMSRETWGATVHGAAKGQMQPSVCMRALTHTHTLQGCGVRGSRAPWQLRHQELGSVPPSLESRPMTCSEVEHGRSEVTGDLYLCLSRPVKPLSPWGMRDLGAELGPHSGGLLANQPLTPKPESETLLDPPAIS